MDFTIRDVGLRFPRTQVRRTRTDSIVIHHLDAHWDVNRTHQHHLSLGWNGIGYNLHVAMNGIISLGRGIEFQGTHKIGFNDRSIGIGCEGRYHSVDRVMPDAQFNALVWLVKHLRKMYGDLRIIGHNEYAATACPGQFFPLAEVQTLEFRQAEQHTPPSHIQESEEKEMTQEQFDKMMDTYLAKQRNSAVSVWAKDAWEHATELGVTDGSSPGATATREQVIVMLDRWLGLFFN